MEDDLFENIRWHLFQDLLQQQERTLANGGEVMTDDRFLSDFSAPWKGVADVDAPKWLQEEYQAYLQQQKQMETSVTIGGGSARVTSTDTSNVIQIWGAGDGPSTIQRGDLPELIRVLQGLVAGPTVGGAVDTSSVSQRSAPVAPTGMSPIDQARHKRNQQAQDYALKQERERQQAIIQRNQLDAVQRRGRW